ncbi:MAG: DUF2796 domain-containing protein [Pseudomonadota bacterium]
MYIKKLQISAVTAGFLLSLVAVQPALSQHVHGVIDLGIVVEDGAIAISLRAPLSDVVGFEHAAENDEQAARLDAAARLLSDADAMFSLPGQAACTLEELTLDGPSYLLALRESHGDHDDHSAGGAAEHDEHDHDSEHDHEDESEHDHDGHDDHDDHDHDSDHGHDDEAVAANDDHDHHDDEHGHDDHDGHADADHDHDHDEHGDHDGEHAEIDARYVWACGESSELNSIGTPFVKEFASVETINIQIVTPAAARVVEADQTLQSIELSGS